MKILVVSLLRMGDIVLSTPVLHGLKQEYPDAEVHLLFNKQFSGLKALLPFVDRFHNFDRELIQRGLGECDRSLFEPMDRVDALVAELSSCGFDRIINLTHNRLSGWICGMIGAQEKDGLCFNNRGMAEFGSSWFRYLNDHVAEGGDEVLHFVDIFYYGSGLPYRSHEIKLTETERGRQEADKILDGVTSFVCVQPLTSDKKKNWGLKNYVQAIQVFKKLNPSTEVFILGAEYEREQIENCILECDKLNTQTHAAVCSLEGAFSLLVKSRALLTGDTGTKHLASATDCQILEICIGSSDYRSTGTYKPGSYILKSKEPCHPCVHSSDCHRTQHFCSESIDPNAVGVAFSHVLQRELVSLKTLAREYSDQFSLYQTFFSHSGFWHARNLGSPFDQRQLLQLINSSSRKLLNHREHTKLVGAYGSEGIKLKAAVRQAFPEVDQINFKKALSLVKEDFERVEGEIHLVRGWFSNFSRISKSPSQLGEFTRHLQGVLQHEYGKRIADSHIGSLKAVTHEGFSNFSRMRKLQLVLQDMFNQRQIKMKLIQSLQTNNTENI